VRALITRAGLPATTTASGMSFVTTDRAPMTLLFPTINARANETPGRRSRRRCQSLSAGVGAGGGLGVVMVPAQDTRRDDDE